MGNYNDLGCTALSIAVTRDFQKGVDSEQLDQHREMQPKLFENLSCNIIEMPEKDIEDVKGYLDVSENSCGAIALLTLSNHQNAVINAFTANKLDK